jgi:hypothetical protein
MNAKLSEAHNNAQNWKEGKSFSDGNMVLGVSDEFAVIAFNNAPMNQNQLVQLDEVTFKSLFAIMYSAGKAQGWIV